MSKTLRVAVIGAGRAGSLFLEAYGKDERVKELVVVEPYETLRQSAVRIPKVVKTYVSAEEFFARDGADLVSIQSSTARHAEQFVAAAKSGAHIYIQKPLAESFEEIAAMCEAARRNKGKAMAICHNYRHEGFNAHIKGLIDEGALGQLLCMRAGYVADYYWTWTVEPPTQFVNPRDFYKTRFAMTDGACHHLDLANWFLGETPSRVTATRQPIKQEQFEADWMSALYTYPGGATLHMDASWAMVAPHKDNFGIELYGTDGSIRDGNCYRLASRTAHPLQYDVLPLLKREGKGHDFDFEAKAMLDAITEGTPVTVTIAEGANAAASAVAALESARLGRTVDVPAFKL